MPTTLLEKSEVDCHGLSWYMEWVTKGQTNVFLSLSSTEKYWYC